MGAAGSSFSIISSSGAHLEETMGIAADCFEVLQDNKSNVLIINNINFISLQTHLNEIDDKLTPH